MKVVADVPSYIKCRKACEATLAANRCWRFRRNVREVPEEELFVSGHRACAGCGCTVAMKLALKASGKDTVVTQATGCMEVVSTPYPETAWRVPWIHVAFENSAAVASGVEAALKALGKKDRVNVVALGGDGGTVDIGFQALSGAMERGHDLTYICYDNEAYMNTGIQRSGSTPYLAATTTTPAGSVIPGNDRPKKDMPKIIAAHGVPYVATASVAFPLDFMEKVRKAVSTKGPAYVHVHATCPLGWGIESDKSIEVARLAVDTGMWVLYEIDHGVGKVTYTPTKKRPVRDYLKVQKRFRHLTDDMVAKIQQDVDAKWGEIFGPGV
ncbi:MAG: pyruvate synthase subunit PorB [Candidatus Hydrothermarchaeota archaeon]